MLLGFSLFLGVCLQSIGFQLCREKEVVFSCAASVEERTMEIVGVIILAVVVGVCLAHSIFGDCLFDCLDCLGFILPGNTEQRSEKEDVTNIDDTFGFIGSSAEVLTQFQQIGDHFEGRVKLNGVQWKALCKSNELSPGTIVIVKKICNLTLEVEEHSRKNSN